MSSSPNAFRIRNTDNDPIKKVELVWEQVVTSNGIRLNIGEVRLNSPVFTLNGSSTLLGYRVYRGTSGFVPSGDTAGQGNCLADESTLGPGALEFVDLSVPAYGQYAYKVAAVYEE